MTAKNFEQLQQELRGHGQEHLLQWWRTLDAPRQESLAAQIAAVDFTELARLIAQVQGSGQREEIAESISPPPALRLPATDEDRLRWSQAARRGREALAGGKVAVLLVAGGQGTRLGFDHPKGMYPVGPVSGKSLFQMHAEKVLATGRRYAATVPYYIMTSEATHAETVAFFASHDYFGLPADDVTFFQQGNMPAIDAETGRVLLADKDRVATSPNGHGGVLQALADEGVLDDLGRREIDHVFYHQVDNPLVKVCDPEFIGLHLEEQSEATTKAIAKQDPHDKVGLLAQREGKVCIVEYSDLPDAIAVQREADGRLRYWAGNMAVHVFDVAFLQRLRDVKLPYHCAVKKVPHVDSEGRQVLPEAPNAYKFERFLFDILPLANRGLVVETDRVEEYDPLKNAEGEHSPESVKQTMSRLYRGWLSRAGAAIADGDTATGNVEISPLFALDADELAEKLPSDFQATPPLYLA